MQSINTTGHAGAPLCAVKREFVHPNQGYFHKWENTLYLSAAPLASYVSKSKKKKRQRDTLVDC